MKKNQENIWNGLPKIDVSRSLHASNPWWDGKPLPKLPVTRRHLVHQMKRRLKAGLAPAIVVRGPRQIGKTTAQLHLVRDILDSGIPANRVFRVQFDELPQFKSMDQPILALVYWYEQFILKKTLNESAHADEETYLFFDEVQNVSDWAPQIKFLVDQSTTHVVITGSSALRIERGRDSLAGRISTIEAGVLSLTEISMFYGPDPLMPFLKDNGMSGAIGQMDFWRELIKYGLENKEQRDACFSKFAERGGYPLGHRSVDIEWDLLSKQLIENVIQRVIVHDLRIGEKGRKRDQALLEEVFRMACRYIGQTPSTALLAREAQTTLNAASGPQRISHYLKFLEETLLLRLIQPLEIRIKKARGNSKICIADHTLRAAWLKEIVPLTSHELSGNEALATLAGHIAESIVGTTLCGIPELGIAYIPERKDQNEIDFVITAGLYRIPIEVKFKKSISPDHDARALTTFIENKHNNAPFGILITRDDMTENKAYPHIITLPLSTFMLLR